MPGNSSSDKGQAHAKVMAKTLVSPPLVLGAPTRPALLAHPRLFALPGHFGPVLPRPLETCGGRRAAKDLADHPSRPRRKSTHKACIQSPAVPYKVVDDSIKERHAATTNDTMDT